MKKIIKAIDKEVRKEIKVPGDKSITHRGIILGSIAQGKTVIKNYLASDDCMHTRKAFEAMGVMIEEIKNDDDNNIKQKKSFASTDSVLIIHGKGIANLKEPKCEIYLGNSGTSIRLLSGLFAGLPFKATLAGDEYLNKRPMKRVIEPLKKMGADISGIDDNFAPLKINHSNKNSLKGIEYNSPIASAQIKSSIILAGLNAEGSSTVIEPLLSRNHTELMLKAFGADIKSFDHAITEDLDGKKIKKTLPATSVKKLKGDLKGQSFTVPSDISSAAFFMVAAAILAKAELTLIEVGVNPTRTGILDVFNKMNVRYRIGNKKLEAGEPVADIVVKDSKIEATTIGGALMPRLIDEIPIIAILAAQAKGTTIIKDAHELRVKESDRIKTTVNLLKTLGVNVEETPDGMIIEGRDGKAFDPRKNQSASNSSDTNQAIYFDSHGDHRLAMSAAIAALHSRVPIEIDKTEFVSTSFPGFFEIIDSLN